MTDKLQALYSGLKDRYDLGSEDEFRNKMNDETKRKAFYDAVSPYYDLGDYDSFNDKLGYKKANAVETATEANRQMVDSITPAAQAQRTEVAMEPQSVEAPEPAPMAAPEAEETVPVAEPSRREQRRQEKQEKLEQGASIAKDIKDIAQGYKEQAKIMREEDKDLERRYLELTTAAGNYATEQCGPMPRKGITSESGWGKAYMDYLNSNDPDNIRAKYNNTKARSDRNNTVSFLEHMANQTERRANQSIAQAESSGVGRTARSIWYGLTQPGSWSLGMSDFWTAENVISLANKIKKGEKLTDYEQAALNAYGTYQEAAEILREYDTRGFKAGQTTGEMVPFMIQMALNPGGSLGTKAAQKGVQKAVSKAAAASGEEAAKAVAEQAMKEYGTMATRDLLRNYGVDGVMARLPIAMRKVGGDLAASAVLANTLQVGSTINDIAERKYGRPVMGEDGRYVFDPEQEKSSLEAIYKGEVAGIIENFTEMMGEWRVLGLADKMSKFGSKNMSRIVRALGDSDFAQGFSKVLRDAHWSGVFGETLEEEYGIILNSLLTGDNKLSDLYDLDQQIDIFLGVGLFGGLVGGAKVASYPTAYVNRKKHLEEVTAKCREWRGAEWDAIQEKIDNADNEGLAAIVKSALQEREAAGEKGREDGKAESILQYVDALQRFRGVTIARDLLPADADEKTLQAFYLQGYDGVDKEAIKAAYEHKKGQLQLIEPNFIKILDDEGINAQVRDVDGQMVNMFEGEYRRMALDYLNAKAAYDGMLDGITDRAQTAARSAETIVRTNDNGGQQIEATTRTGEKVHIIDGGVTMIGGTADLNNSSKSIIIRHEDGKKEMVSPLFIKSVDNVQNTEEVARLASERAAQEVLFNESQEAEIQDVDAGMQAMADVQLGEERGLEQAEYQQGDEVVLPDGTTGIINQGIGQTEDGKVEVIWNRPEGNVVEHLTADELYNMQHPTAQETVQEENVQDTEGAVRLSAQEQAVSDWEARHGDNAMNKLNQTKVYAEKQLAEKQEQLAKVQQELNDLPDIEDDATTKKVAELTKKKEDLEAGISQYSEVLDRMNTIEAGYAARNAQAEQPTAEEENVTSTAANTPVEATVPEAVESGLTPAEEKRMNILLKRQQKRRLTKKEQKELDGLLAQSGLITDQSAVNPQTEEAINVVQASPIDETTKAAAKERLAELDAIAKSRMLTADEREEYLQANDLAYDVERAPKKEMKAARERIRAISTLQMQMPERSQRSAEEQQMFEELELLKLGAMQQLITEDDINETQRLMNQYEKSTGIKMRLITDITKASRQDIMRAMNGRAWNDADNEVVFVLPRMLYEGVDLGQMFRHEVLSHFNLKNSMSEDEWNEFLDKVYEAMPKSERARLDRIYRGVYGRSSEQDYHRLLADEFIASNAEQLYGRAAGFRTVARKIVDAVRGWLNGGKQTTALTQESALPEFILSKLRDVYGQRIEKRADNGKSEVRNSIAYHGSGADFNAFDSRFMSTGEGSQVYGWGVYVSTNKETGMAYADVANHPKVSYKGQEAPTSRTTDLLNGIIESLENGDDFEVAKSTTYKLWENSLKDEEKAFINGLQVSDFDIKAPDGQFLYTVDIPDDNGENYLHWDGILTKRQSEKIVNALLATPEVIDEFGEEAENEIRSALGYGTYGSQVEGGLNYFLGDMRNYATGEDMGAERNSKFLSNLGFVGMQVAVDRGGGQRFPGDNFVIYDDQDVKILEKTRFSVDGNIEGYTDEMQQIMNAAIADGTFMKALNGQPTNLSEQQWLQVRTQNFINWFGDWMTDPANASKVLDENGEPRVVYHGTKWNPIAEAPGKAVFDDNRVGQNFDNVDIDFNFFFTASEAAARGYGEAVPVFLNIRNMEQHVIHEEVTSDMDEELGHEIVINAHDAGSENDETQRVDNPDGVMYTIRAIDTRESGRKFREALQNWESENKDETEAQLKSYEDQVKQLEEAIDAERKALFEKMDLASKLGMDYDTFSDKAGLAHIIDSAAHIRKEDTSKLDDLLLQLNDATSNQYRLMIRDNIEGRPVFEQFEGDNVEYDYRDTDIYAVDDPNNIKSATANDGSFSTTNNDIRYSIEDENTEDVFNRALEEYGTTDYSGAAGYMMPNGQYLDFSEGSGVKTLDHRNVGLAYENTADEAYEYMYDFMRRGAIRMKPESGGFELAVAPTPEQRRRLREYIAENDGDVIMDILNPEGGNPISAEYYEASPARVMGAIDRYFNDGIIPQSDTRYSITPEMDAEYRKAYEENDTKKAQQMVAEAFKAAFPYSVIVNRKGEPTLMYHGTPSPAFNVFAQPGENLQGLIWLTRNKKYAETYANPYEDEDYKKYSEPNAPQKNGLYKLFVNMTNPAKIGYLDDEIGSEEWEKTAKVFNLTPEQLYERTKMNGDKSYEKAAKIGYSIYEYTRGEKFANLLKEYGYDGVRATEGREDIISSIGVVSPSQVKSAEPFTFDDNGELIPLSQRFTPENDDIRFSMANEENKQPDKIYDVDDGAAEIRYSLSKNNRQTISAWMDKREDLTVDQKKSVLDYLDTLDNITLQLAAGRWFAKGVVRFPEDMDKVEQAVAVARKAKVDPLQYDSPMDVINRHADIEIKEKPIDPETVSTLHRAKELPDGIVVYDVDDSQESRENMRKIINTHFGKECSPWCLLQGDDRGNLTESSRRYWHHYSAYPKQVAFRNGRLLAFSANHDINRLWWDRQDASHKGVPVLGKIEGDALGRTGVTEYNSETGEKTIAPLTYRGNKDNGLYEEWYDDVLVEKSTNKDGKHIGTLERWHNSGRRQLENHYDENGELDGEQRAWADRNDGILVQLSHYEHGIPVGIQEEWYDHGQLWRHMETAKREDANPEDVFGRKYKIISPLVEYHVDGKLKSYDPYGPDGKIEGVAKKWYSNGNLSYEANYVNGLTDGKSISYDTKERPIRIENYKQSMKEGPTEEYEYTTSGERILVKKGSYKDNVKDGVWEYFNSDGSLEARGEYKDGNQNGLQEIFDRDGRPYRRFMSRDNTTYGTEERYEYPEGLVLLTYHMEDGLAYNTEKLEGYKPKTRAELEKGIPDNVPRFSISAETDKEYMDAVESGDMKTAEAMVKEAAEAAMPNTKIVDKKGNPMVVYHGTKNKFNMFRYNPDDIGFHFGDRGTARTRVGRRKGSAVLPFFLDIQNPITIERDLGAWDADYLAKELYQMGILTETEARSILYTPTYRYKRDNRAANLDLRKKLLEKGYDGVIYNNYFESDGTKSYIALRPNQMKSAEPVTYDKDGNVIPLSERFNAGSADIRYSLVTDPELLAQLEAGEKSRGFRNVTVNEDGTLGSPMAGKLGKKGARSVKTSPFEIGKWEQADENPGMATDEGKVNLIKPNGRGSVGSVDYNPYIHIRPTSVNRQFTQAWKRPELAYIETEYPTSELKGEYKAEKAKLSTGRHDWNGGELILSRYDKPMRIVPWEEVADEWVKEFEKTGVTFDIVPPALLPILDEKGVKILPPKAAAGTEAMKAYNDWREEAHPGEEGFVTDVKDNDMISEETPDFTTRYSLSTWENGGREDFVSFLDRQIASGNLPEDAREIFISKMDNVYKEAKKIYDSGDFETFNEWNDREVARDSEGNAIYTVIKPNNEYGMNLDFSLVCKKRRTLNAVLNEMIDRDLVKYMGSANDDLTIARINEIIRKYGFETACRLCFVDAKRFRQVKVADDFVQLYNGLVNKLIPRGSKIKAGYFDFGRTGRYTITGEELNTIPDDQLNTAALQKIVDAEDKKKGDKTGRTVTYLIAKHLLEHPEDRRYVQREDFISTRGFENVKAENKAVLGLYNKKKGSGGPKASESDVQYLGDVSKVDWSPAAAFEVGGVRIQSFSDFVAHMVFDYVQMVADLAAGRYPAHAYTKEELFAKLFGLTGIKINLSLVPGIAEDGVAPGLDKDGNYVWQENETFPYDEAVAVQGANGYRENCGTIAVGVSDEHILKLLSDPNIRMVIPYHKSGLNKTIAIYNNIDQFTDYTNSQNTRYQDGKKLTGTDHDNEPNYNELLRSTGNPEAAAQAYLDWCKDNNFLPKFDQFAYDENGNMRPGYYKLLEDFTTYVPNAEGNMDYYPQRAIDLVLPEDGAPFGSFTDLMKRGLSEDEQLTKRQRAYVAPIVDEIEQMLKQQGKETKPVKKEVEEDNSDNLRLSTIGEIGASRDNTTEGVARLHNLQTAREMEEQLKPDWNAKEDENALKIKVATGWERGGDGKWRYEVPDAKFKEGIFDKKWGGKTTLADIVDAPELFRLYPDLKDIKVKRETRSGYNGHYSHDDNMMYVGTGLYNTYMKRIKEAREAGYTSAGTYERWAQDAIQNAGGTLVHEMQHAIQRREGFAGGGSANSFKPGFDKEAYYKKIDEYNALITKWNSLPAFMRRDAWTLRDEINKLNRAINRERAANILGQEGYLRLGGEVEARNIRRRLNMTDDEKRNSLLASTEDVARGDQMYIFRALAPEPEGDVRYSTTEEINDAGNIITRYDNQGITDDNEYMTDRDVILAVEESDALMDDDRVSRLVGDYHILEEEDRAQGRRDFAGGEMEDLVNDELIPLLRTISTGRDMTRYSMENADQRIFISNAERAVRDIKQDKGTPEQWIAMLQKNGGLKAAEDKWLGLSDWLKSQDGKVSKNEILEFIAQNGIQIEETHYAEQVNQDEQEAVHEGLNRLNREFEDFYWEAEAKRQEAMQKASDYAASLHNKYGATREEKAITEELVEYQALREAYQNISPADDAFQAMVDKYGDDFSMAFDYFKNGNRWELEPTTDPMDEELSSAAQYYLNVAEYGSSEEKPINSTRLGYTTNGLSNKREIALTVPNIEEFQADDYIHFGDADGGRSIAWIRFGDALGRAPGAGVPFTELFDENGNTRDKNPRILVIDEIQSNRHQAGRERGYKDNKAYKAWLDYRAELSKKYPNGWNPQVMTQEEMDHLESLRAKMVDKTNGEIPAAPFEKNWMELAMKRMLRLAAEEGYDKLAWTTGDQQTQRYNIGGLLRTITRQESDNLGERNYSLELNDNGGKQYIVTDDEGNVIRSLVADFNGKTLTDLVGKEMAVKMMSMKENETLDGEALRIGGQGMKTFYDQMMVNFMNKYGKQWGVKVEDVFLPLLEEGSWQNAGDIDHGGLIMHSVEVTPEMKESVMKGQLLFSISDNFNDAVNELQNKGISIDNEDLLDEYDLSNVTLSKKGDYVTLTHFITDQKGQGAGTRFMNDLTKVADDNGWTLALTPDDSFGASSVKRLKDFYKRFGFKDNKGRNTDFEINESMIRRPEGDIRYSLNQELREAEAQTDANPTEGQKEAGNYKKGHVRLFGMDLSIEQPKGSTRRGTDADGKQWEQEMHNTYGYIRGTMGRDKDHIDVFLGNNLNSDKVFVVDQRNVKDNTFDEHKVMLGFDNLEDARQAYLSNYEEGWQGLSAITETSLDNFKEWALQDGRRVQPFSSLRRYMSVTAKQDAEYEQAYRNGDSEAAMRLVKAAFMAKFPNTKVLDKNGDPAIVYHGSPWGGFTEFEAGNGEGRPIYFAAQEKMADDFRTQEDYMAEEWARQGSPINPQMYRVFLNIENPLEIGDVANEPNAEFLSKVLGMTDEQAKQFIEDQKDYKPSLYNYLDELEAGIIINNQIRNTGHDGFHGHEFGSPEKSEQWGVYNPSQIKSAEPFTFDDNGVLIPLSERFNDENNDIRYSFVGENAADALKKNSGEWYMMYDLGQARKMEEQGRSAEWIKNVTGWERGTDGKWRFEMEDFMLKPDYADAMKVGDAVQDNRLLKAYPELKDMPVMFVHTDTPDTSVYDGTGFLIEYDNDDTAIKDLMHEIQHYIQEKEGFAEGSYPEMFSDNKEHPFLKMSSDKVARTMAKAQVAWDVDNDASLDDISKSLKKSQVGTPEYEAYSYIYVMAASGKSIREAKGEIIDEANKLRDDAIYLASDTNSPLNKYRRTAGEVEARNVQRRMGMTFEQRMKSLARATEDVDRKDQILIYSNAINEFKEENEPIMNPLTELADVRYSISLEPSRIRSEYNNGDITVFSPRTIADVQAAVMRESFTHQDIRNINGWDDLKDAAYRMSGGEIATRALRNGLDFDAATEEWMYENAERMVVPFEIMMSRNGVELLYQMTGEEIRMYLASRNDLLDDADLFLAKEEMPTQPRVRYSSGSPISARDLYDRSQESLANKLYRSYVDYTKPLRDLQNIIAKESGKPIEDFENALEAENQRSSKSKSEIEKFELERFEKIRDAVKALEKATGMKYNDVLRYLIAKHGLERNVVLAQRDAEADFKKYQQDNPNGTKTLDDFFNEKRERDYSGLTSLSGKDNVTDAELYAEDLVNSVERLAPGETDDLWQTIADAVEVIQKKRYQSGMISRDQMKHEADMFEHYIPLRGFAETIAEDVYDYYENTTRNRPQRDKKAQGRTSLADDPLATLGAMAASAIVAGNKNLMKQRFLNMVENHPNDIATIKDVWVVNTGTPSNPVWETEYPDIHDGMDADAIKAELDRFEQLMEQMKAVGMAKKATNKLNIKWRTLGQQAQQHIITVRRNGQEQMIIINGNPQVARTVNGINNPDANLSDFMRGVRAVQRFMAANFTTRNPAFVVSNLARDLGFAVMAVTAKENADYRHRFMRNITGVVTKTVKMGTLIGKWQKGTLDMNKDVERYFAEFMENGGETGYTAENTVDAFRKKMEQGLKDKNFLSRGWETVLEYFELCNRSVEDFTRFMTFMTSRQMGRSMQRSVSDAKNITVNFNRKGSGEMGQKYIASAYLFLNAGIQSLQNVAKMSGIELNMDDVSGKIKLDINKGKLAKSAATLFGSQIVLGMLIPMLNELMMGIIGGDDDDDPEVDENGVVISTNPYRRLTEFERRNNICIWLGGDSFIKIPIAIELRAFYGLGETLYGMMAGIPNPNPEADVVDQMLDLLPVNFIENGGLVPDAVAPFWESFITNRNYQGVPLYNDSDFLEQSPEASKAYSNTGDLYMTISRWVNELGGGDEVHKSKLDTRLTNPAIMQHIVEGYLGGLLTTSRQTVKLLGQPVKKFIMGKEVEAIPAREWPVVNRLYINTDKRNDDRYVKDRYYYYRDKAEQIRHDERGYLDRIDDPRYAEKYEELVNSPEYLEYITFGAYDKWVKEAHKDVKDYGDEFKVFEVDAMRELVNALDEETKGVIDPEQWGKNLRGK